MLVPVVHTAHYFISVFAAPSAYLAVADVKRVEVVSIFDAFPCLVSTGVASERDVVTLGVALHR